LDGDPGFDPNPAGSSVGAEPDRKIESGSDWLCHSLRAVVNAASVEISVADEA
jgi:hypothetical protein